MIIEFLGAAREVTGSCHYVSFNDIHFLVDCGMEQGADLYENHMHILTIPDFCHCYIKMDSAVRFLLLRPHVNYVVLCFEIRRIFRSLKQSGAIERIVVQVNQRFYHCMI